MSEEKKAYMGAAAYGASEPKQAAADGGGTPPAGKVPADKVPDEAPVSTEDPKRGRSQNVLPGILGKQLRAAYGELLNSPVPDRFNDLIKQLQRQESASSDTPRDKEEST